MISNSQSQSKKRSRDSMEGLDITEGEKMSKVESASKISEAENSRFKFPLQDISQATPPLTEINSTLYRSQNRNVYLDLIWKTEIPRGKFHDTLLFKEKVTNREGLEFNLAVMNVFYPGSQCSSLVFVFQNGKGLADDDFENEVAAIGRFMQSNEEQNSRESNTKINGIGLNGKSNVSLETKEKADKMCEEIEIDISDNEMKISQETVQVQVPDQGNGNLNQEGIGESQSNNSNLEGSNNINSDSSLNSQSSDNTSSSIHSSESGVSSQLQNSQSSNEEAVYSPIEENAGSRMTPNMTQTLQQKEYKPIDDIIKEKFQQSESHQDLNLGGLYYDDEKDISNYQGLTFDISFSITIVNFKTLSFTFKQVKLGEILIKEIPLTTYFYFNSLPREDPKIVVDLLSRKIHNYDTGFTGIVNEAMTCYMNSMLQTLNVLGYFKKAVFQIPLEESVQSCQSVAFSLQRLFYDLMNEKESVNTNRLVSSFGWSRDQIFIQHDVQEFNLLLCDIMENRMKGTKAEGTFKYLFEGKIVNYIECLDVDYKSKRVESFCDLQLTVKGCKNIYESFNKYTEEEILDNEDKYQTETYGKQKARKGLKFQNFPPVLILQLKRFEYNPRKDQMDKINDYFQYDEEIDLAPYISKDGDSNSDNTYSLHSVVVHKGGINSGHYYAFIRPYHNKQQWFMFNDEIVREADYDEVFTYNYGGNLEMYKHKDRGTIGKINSRPDANAYILVYIKNSLRRNILCEVTNLDVPEEIKQMIEKEKADEKRREILRMRKTKNMNVSLIAKDDIMKHTDLSIVPSQIDINKDINLPEFSQTTFNLPKDLKIKEFIRFVSKCTLIPEHNLLLYTFRHTDPCKIINRHLFTMNYVDQNIIKQNTIKDLHSVFCDFRFSNKVILYLYIEVLSPVSKNLFSDYDKISVLELNTLIHKDNISSDSEDNIQEFEYQVDNEEGSIIYIPSQNKYVFKKNNFDFGENYELMDKMSICQDEGEINRENLQNEAKSVKHYKLLVFKYLKIDESPIMPTNEDSNNSNNSLISQNININTVIDEIAVLDWEESAKQNFNIQKFRDYKQIYMKYISDRIINKIGKEKFENCRVTFYLEKTSGTYQKKINLENIVLDIIPNEKNSQTNGVEVNKENMSENLLSKMPDELTTAGPDSEMVKPVTTVNTPEQMNQPTSNLPKEIPESDQVVKFEDLSEVIEQNNSNDCFIIIVNLSWEGDTLSNLIVENTHFLYSCIYLPLVYHDYNEVMKVIQNSNSELAKFAFLIDANDFEIYSRLLQCLKANYDTLPKLLKENIPIFHLDVEKELITEDQFIEQISVENLHMDFYNSNQNNIIQEMMKFPLIKYIGALRNVQKHKIDFRIKYIKSNIEDEDEDFETVIIALFDEMNNQMVKVFIALPKENKTCNEIIDYIYDPVLSKFYNGTPKDQFYFLIQHQHKTFAYDIFTNKEDFLRRYEGTRDICIEYRLQPFTQDDIESFKKEDNIKLFVAFITKEGNSACDPLIVYINNNSLVREVKMMLINRMQKIAKLSVYGEITIRKVKFYTYSLMNYRPIKDILLINSKDEEPLLNFFKGRGAPYNLLVEFLVSDTTGGFNNSLGTYGASFIDSMGMSLSMDPVYKSSH